MQQGLKIYKRFGANCSMVFVNGKKFCIVIFVYILAGVAVRNRYTGRFTAASIWEILSLIVLLARDPRRTSTHQLAEHEDCIKGEQKILFTN